MVKKYTNTIIIYFPWKKALSLLVEVVSEALQLVYYYELMEREHELDR
jgi:hypothetical protein